MSEGPEPNTNASNPLDQSPGQMFPHGFTADALRRTGQLTEPQGDGNPLSSHTIRHWSATGHDIPEVHHVVEPPTTQPLQFSEPRFLNYRSPAGQGYEIYPNEPGYKRGPARRGDRYITLKSQGRSFPAIVRPQLYKVDWVKDTQHPGEVLLRIWSTHLIEEDGETLTEMGLVQDLPEPNWGTPALQQSATHTDSGSTHVSTDAVTQQLSNSSLNPPVSTNFASRPKGPPGTNCPSNCRQLALQQNSVTAPTNTSTSSLNSKDPVPSNYASAFDYITACAMAPIRPRAPSNTRSGILTFQVRNWLDVGSLFPEEITGVLGYLSRPREVQVINGPISVLFF